MPSRASPSLLGATLGLLIMKSLFQAIQNLDKVRVSMPKEVTLAMRKARKFERASLRARRGWETKKGIKPPSEKTYWWNEFFGKHDRNEFYQYPDEPEYSDREG